MKRSKQNLQNNNPRSYKNWTDDAEELNEQQRVFELKQRQEHKKLLDYLKLKGEVE